MRSNQEWKTARELAGLPDLPTAERRVRDKAQREGWQSRTRKGRGGGCEYHLSSLPEITRQALLDQMIENLPEKLCPLPNTTTTLPATIEQPKLQPPATLKGWQRRTMDARCVLLLYLEQLATAHGMNKAIDSLVRAAKAGTLPSHLQTLVGQANARGGKTGARTLSRSSLLRWKRERAAADGNAVALAPKEVEREAVPPWAALFLKCYRKPQQPSVADALAELALILPVPLALPSEGQCYRLLGKMSAVDRERGRKTGNALRALKGYRPRDTSDMLPCEVYQCDGHSFKARIAHPVHGKPFHPEVCAVVDAATRLVMGWSAGLSESNQTVADALRHACIVDETKPYGGIPAIFYTDPGSGNLATVNADPVLGRYARLGITFKTGIVGNSQARGLVERLQQTLWIKAAKQLPTFTGKSMDHTTEYKTSRLVDKEIRKTGSSALLTSWPQFLDLCRQAVERYNHTPHSALPRIIDVTGRKRHMTPFEAYTAHLNQGFVPPTMNSFEIDDCFRPRIQVTTRRGEVRVFGNVYYDGELVHHGGEKVFVEYAVQDGSRVWVRDPQERLICIAGFEANRARMFPKSATEEAADKREKRRLEVAERKIDEIHEERRGVVDLTPQAGLIEVARAELIAHQKAENVFDVPTDYASRIRMYRNLTRRVEHDEALTAMESQWLETFLKSKDHADLMALEKDLAISQ